MSTSMNKISGLTLAVTLVVGVGGGYALRMITTRGAVETSPPTPGAIAATSPAEDPGVAELQARLDQTEGELAEARCALGSAGGINACQAMHDGGLAAFASIFVNGAFFAGLLYGISLLGFSIERLKKD